MIEDEKKILYLLPIILASGCSQSEDPNGETQEARTTLQISMTRSESEILNSINMFAFDLVKTIENGSSSEVIPSTSNYLVSPLGVAMTLGMIANGAEGESLKEICTALHIPDNSLNGLNECCHTLLNAFEDSENGLDMKVNNYVWSKENLFQQTFQNTVKDLYNASAFHGSMNSSSDSNLKWLETESEKEDFDNAVMNAFDFKGLWDLKFNKNYTAPDYFYNSVSSKSFVDFMNTKGLVFTSGNDFCAMLRLTMEKESFSMDFILPDEDKSLEDIFENLTLEGWNELVGSLQSRSYKVSIPKFEFNGIKTDMKKSLVSLGINGIFDEYGEEIPNVLCDFEGEATYAYVKKIYQNASMICEEEGTTVKTSTVGAIEEASSLPNNGEFKVNRPFMFVISENSTGAILFMGKILRP